MTVRLTRVLFLLFAAFAAGFVLNLHLLQPDPKGGEHGRVSIGEAEKARQARAARLALDTATSPDHGTSPDTSAGLREPVAANGEVIPPPAANPTTILTRSVGPIPVRSEPRAHSDQVPRVTARDAAAGTETGPTRFARVRLDSLQSTGTADHMPHAPDAEGDTATIAAVQRELSARGYGPLTADGVAGLMTRAAIMAFEHDNGYALTGEATETLLSRILLGTSADVTDQAQAGRVRSRHAEIVVRTVQQALAQLGYEIQRIDGRFGADTARAITQFESREGMKPRGRISAEVFGRLAHAVSASRTAQPR